MKSFGSHTQWSKCLLLISFVLSMSMVVAKDECALEYWKRDLPQTTYNTTEIDFINKIKAARRAIINPVALKPGELNCRYTGHSDTVVNYYSCMKMAIFYEITIEKFFSLNPTLKKDCSNIQPSSGYCVEGFIEPVRATDGLCGPKNSNATCLGQLVGQCCNAATWKCGNATADCAPGNCYEGACVGDKVFSTDGTCGTQHGLRSCIGKWGDCCHNNGTCGTGPSFCGKDVCQMGNCTTPIVLTPPTLKGNTTDGTCGGTKAYTCSTAYGLCCNKNGQCGGLDSDCGAGCQSKFGRCNPNVTSSTSSSAPTSTAAPISKDGKCGSASTTGATCIRSTFGSCCSVKGNCGSTPAFCAVSNSCQPKFGVCTPVSTDGKCGTGSATGATCLGSTYGDCCSAKSNCGVGPFFCATTNNCQSAYGTCLPISTDGKCGSASSTNAICSGSGFGDCCSVNGNCGSSAAFCSAGNLCQPNYGTCYPTSTDGKCGSASVSLVNASCSGSSYGNCCSVKGNCGSTDAFCLTSNSCQPIFGTCT